MKHYKNVWQNIVVGLITLILIASAFIGFKAYKLGALMNLTILGLIFAAPIVLMLRLPFLVKGDVKWGFWKQPFAKENRKFWLHILPRVVFWGLCIVVLGLGMVPKQLPADVAVVIQLFTYAGGAALILISLFPKIRGSWPMTLFSAFAGLALMVVVIRSLSAGFQTQDYVIVEAPIAGTSLVVQGGFNPLVNYHYAVPSQRHAVDFVVPGENGRLYDGKVKEEDPCFGVNYLAAVDGEVVTVVNDLPDNEIGQTDRKNPAGNYVVIKMDATHYALSAHLKQGSATVQVGDQVKAGDVIGQCGNSGNTSGPHLHFQVQRYPDLFKDGGYTYPLRFTNISRIRGDEETFSDSGEAIHLRRNDLMRAPAIDKPAEFERDIEGSD